MGCHCLLHQCPDQHSNPGTLLWEHGVLATGPLAKSLTASNSDSFSHSPDESFLHQTSPSFSLPSPFQLPTKLFAHGPSLFLKTHLFSHSHSLSLVLELLSSRELSGQLFLVIHISAKMPPPPRSPSDYLNLSSCCSLSPSLALILWPRVFSADLATPPKRTSEGGCGRGPGHRARAWRKRWSFLFKN